MRNAKQTSELSEIFVSEDARTLRVPKLEDPDAPTTRRGSAQTVTLVSRGRRATFTLDSVVANSAILTGPLTFAVGDRIDMTIEIAGEPHTLAAEIVSVTTADLLTDHVTVAFTEPTSRERLATLHV